MMGVLYVGHLQKGALIQGLIKEHSPKLIVEVTPSCCPFLLLQRDLYISIYMLKKSMLTLNFLF
jgi:hypothetical protein